MADFSSASNSALKAIFLLHFIFSSWGIQGSWSPDSYFFYNAMFFITLLWSMHHTQSEDPVQLALCINALSIVFDVIALAIYYPAYIHTVGSERFSVGMAIINLVLRPITCVGLYRNLQDRGGNFDASAFPGNLFGTTHQRSPYEDMDRPHTVAPPAAPDAPSASSEKPYYNIVG